MLKNVGSRPRAVPRFLPTGLWAWFEWLRRVVGALARPLRAGLRRLDFDDERRALRVRETLGKRLCLVSWGREPDGTWRARLSGPGLVVTMERTARGRCRAIARAELAMRRVLASRAGTPQRLSPRPLRKGR